MIETICSYCGCHMGYKDGQGVTGISHAICFTCFVVNHPDYTLKRWMRA